MSGRAAKGLRFSVRAPEKAFRDTFNNSRGLKDVERNHNNNDGVAVFERRPRSERNLFLFMSIYTFRYDFWGNESFTRSGTPTGSELQELRQQQRCLHDISNPFQETSNLHTLCRSEERGESSNSLSDILKLSGLNSFSCFPLLRYLPVLMAQIVLCNTFPGRWNLQ